METERLEVLFSPVKNKSYAHSFLLYTVSPDQQFIARGGPSSEIPLDLATGNSRLNTVADLARHTEDKDNINVPSAFRTTVSTGSEAAADWKQIQTFAGEANGQYGYHASQNSNSFTHAALTRIGKGDLAFPSGIQPADVIGWTNTLTQPLGMPLVNDVVSSLGYLTRPGPWSLSRQALESGTFLDQGGSVTTPRDHTGYAVYSGPPAGLSDLLLALGTDTLNLAERGWSAVLDGLNTVTDPTQSYGIWERCLSPCFRSPYR